MKKDRAALILKMMSNPIRLSILKILSESECGEICVGNMEEIIKIKQSSVSQHLGHLRNCNILNATKKGKKVCYRIVDEDVMKILKVIELDDEFNFEENNGDD